VSGFDLIWYTKKRDWKWFWLRKQRIRHQEPIRPIDMSKITAIRPDETWFAKALEAKGVELVDRRNA
jgi:hypothetical protein